MIFGALFAEAWHGEEVSEKFESDAETNEAWLQSVAPMLDLGCSICWVVCILYIFCVGSYALLDMF